MINFLTYSSNMNTLTIQASVLKVGSTGQKMPTLESHPLPSPSKKTRRYPRHLVSLGSWAFQIYRRHPPFDNLEYKNSDFYHKQSKDEEKSCENDHTARMVKRLGLNQAYRRQTDH